MFIAGSELTLRVWASAHSTCRDFTRLKLLSHKMDPNRPLFIQTKYTEAIFSMTNLRSFTIMNPIKYGTMKIMISQRKIARLYSSKTALLWSTKLQRYNMIQFLHKTRLSKTSIPIWDTQIILFLVSRKWAHYWLS